MLHQLLYFGLLVFSLSKSPMTVYIIGLRIAYRRPHENGEMLRLNVQNVDQFPQFYSWASEISI